MIKEIKLNVITINIRFYKQRFKIQLKCTFARPNRCAPTL